MVLNTVCFARTNDATTPDVTGFRVGIFPAGGEGAPLATREFTREQATDNGGFQLLLDLTQWGNENPVPEGSYAFRVKNLGPEGSESPWGTPTADFALTNLEAPAGVSVS